MRSSTARRLGLDAAGTGPADRDVEGVVEMTLDATRRFAGPLTDERLFAWHAALFPTGRSGMRKIIVGAWRDDHDGPMQVVSGPVGKEEAHDEAPAAPLLPEEMVRFLAWANGNDRTDAVMRKARFWLRTAQRAINDRQRFVLNRLLDGFAGRLATKKWAVLATCSHETALRDIQNLIDQGLLKKDEGGGRSTSFSLVGDETRNSLRLTTRTATRPRLGPPLRKGTPTRLPRRGPRPRGRGLASGGTLHRVLSVIVNSTELWE